MEIMGKEFRIIQNGLDPNEVTEFLKAAIGSSEDSFRKLEQFATLNVATKEIDESITQAKQLAESAKQQAQVETRQECEQILFEAKEQAQEMVDQTKKKSDIVIDDIRAVLTDAVNKAFERAKETVTIYSVDLDDNVHKDEVSYYDQIPVDRQQHNGKSSDQQTETMAVTSSDEIEGELEEGHDHDLQGLQRSLEALENSLTSLYASEDMVEKPPEFQSAEKSEHDVESRDKPPEAKASNSENDDNCQYIGDVLVAILGGASESWRQELRKRTLQLPGVSIKTESCMDDNTIILSFSLEEPTLLHSILQGMPNVEKVVEGSTDGTSLDNNQTKLLNEASKELKQPTIVIVELNMISETSVSP